MPYGKSYQNEKAPGVPEMNRRQPAKRVSYDNTRRTPMKDNPANLTGHLGTVKSYAKP